MSIQVYKLAHGLAAQTRLHAPDISENSRMVFITMKRSNGMVSTIARIERKENTGMSVFYPFSDFCTVVNSEKCRATEKNIARLHAEALDCFGNLIAQALAFYASKQAA